MAAATLTSSDNSAAMDDRRLLELLIMVVVIHSLLRKEGDDDDGQLDQMKDMVKELSMAINRRGDQSAVSNQLLLALTQRLIDDAQLRSLDGGENEGQGQVASSASDHQLMETAAAAAAKKKKKRNKRNKAAAKHKGTKRRSWLGGGIISLLMIMAAAFGSITSLSHIPQSDGSSKGNKAPPTLPPSASTSLRQRDLQSSNNMASASPASVNPLAAVVQAPIFSPADASNPPTYFPTMLAIFRPTFQLLLFHLPPLPNHQSFQRSQLLLRALPHPHQLHQFVPTRKAGMIGEAMIVRGTKSWMNLGVLNTEVDPHPLLLQ